MRMSLWRKLVPLVLVLGFAQAPSHAAVIIQTGLNTSQIPGLTGFATTGALMDGLSVRAVFSGGVDETRLWADTGATSGGVTGTGWGLSVAGDTFTSLVWSFTFAAGTNLGDLTQLVLDGRNALTVFDRTLPSPGTPGSAAGSDFDCNANPACTANQISGNNVTALYDFQVNTTGNPAVGDLWQTLTLTFTGNRPNSNFLFTQDTDNDSRLFAPEPGSLALVGLALGVAGWLGRRRRNAR